jgi:hypothetical protein
MGFLAANNIHQEILVSKGVKKEAAYLTFPEVPPMIALACGKQAISYSEGVGTQIGEDIMEMFFNDDLGFKSKCLISLIPRSGANQFNSLLGLPTAGYTKRGD